MGSGIVLAAAAAVVSGFCHWVCAETKSVHRSSHKAEESRGLALLPASREQFKVSNEVSSLAKRANVAEQGWTCENSDEDHNHDDDMFNHSLL